MCASIIAIVFHLAGATSAPQPCDNVLQLGERVHSADASSTPASGQLVAAYYLNREQDVERNVFMQRMLKEVGIRPARIGVVEAIKGVRVIELLRTPEPYVHTEMVQMIRSQRRCASKLAEQQVAYEAAKNATGWQTRLLGRTWHLARAQKAASMEACVHQMVQGRRNPCQHFTAYGNMSHILHSVGRSHDVCGRQLSNFLSWLKGIRQIHEDLARLRTAMPRGTLPPSSRDFARPDEMFVLMMEDDTRVVRTWQHAFCQLLRDHPPGTWDIAKVDTDDADTSVRAKWQSDGPKVASGLRRSYTTSQLNEMRANSLTWLKAEGVTMTHVPFVWGLGGVLLREGAIPQVLDLLEEELADLTDYLIGRLFRERKLRVAVSHELLCDPNSELQSKSTLSTKGNIMD